MHDASDHAALRQALELFTSLGAPAAAQLTRHKMRALGIRSIPAGRRTATQADPLGLTRREREVLELICAGHSNAETAAKLVLSTRTVDHHVSAVLAKLDAPTRGVAAARAARLGLAAPSAVLQIAAVAQYRPREGHRLGPFVLGSPFFAAAAGASAPRQRRRGLRPR